MKADRIGIECTSTELKKTRQGRCASTCYLTDAPEGGIALTRLLTTPPANAAFTPEELEKRIEYYAALAQAQLPLFAAKRKASAA